MREMEIKAARGDISWFENDLPDTLYFGGGTPTVYSVSEIEKLAKKAMRLFFNKFPDEWTVEANPDDITEKYLAQLAETGVNRLSIGIQSFIDRDLQIMRRRHSAIDGIKAVENAKKAGFKNISIDLIYGFQGMSLFDWEYNLDRAISLDIQHISAYHLSIESKTLLGKMAAKGKFAPVDENLSAMQYEMLENKLLESGYIHYEISNFAMPDFFSRHNSAYWTKKPYIGIGPSAHSYNGKNLRMSNIANNIEYIDSIGKGIIPENTEILSEIDLYNESVMTGLRTVEGVDISQISDRFRKFFEEKAGKYLLSGALAAENGKYKIPSKYFLISDSIITDFIMVDN
jgi:oxygen-independent coproporphyrinogen-3 oxidase